MRCLLCLDYSLHVICKNCLKTILKPTLQKRILDDGFVVYSFYKYSELSKLLHTKHTYIGAKVFSQLSDNAILPFLKTVNIEDVYLLPVDDHTRGGYSHTAVMAQAVKDYVKPIFGSLRAKNKIRYSGQKLNIRKTQKRNFRLSCKEGINVILLDDIVTSGHTLMEAREICEKHNINVLFAITLADARES
ncbi:MAG: ComF family protein [Sulfurospirillaceae bacterium]|nr:ComF family protein [Sulfurospirillaceae bacterium]